MRVADQPDPRQALREALTDFPPIPDLMRQVYSSMGSHDEDPSLMGFHTFASPTRVVVYLISLRGLGIFEADNNGQTVVVTVNVSRIRRVVRSEDATKTSLTLELEAGQYQSVADSLGNVSTLPAGYELSETSDVGRRSLRLFQLAVSRVLNQG